MRIKDTFLSAIRAVSINASRSLLTMLGIIIGVGSVSMMTGIGKSMEGVILSQISILGSNNMIIFPGEGPGGGAASARVGYNSITIDDIKTLETLKTVTEFAPMVFVSGTISAGKEVADAQILGTNPNYYLNYDIAPSAGRLLDQSDEDSKRMVAVLGNDTARDLFYSQNPIGKKVKVGTNSFTIVGIAESLGTAFFQNQDERIYIPLSTALQITQQTYYNAVPFQRTVDAELAQKDVELLLRNLHTITNPDDDDFIVQSSIQAQQILGSVSLGLTSFITLIATVSLVVGGIGIMNIMLVAVTERTKEIGLRKALGATKRDILLQFLIESVLLTFIGGLIGVVFGISATFLLALIVNKLLADYVFAISTTAIWLALLMAATTGLLFGVYPAKKASLLSPMEALRYE